MARKIPKYKRASDYSKYVVHPRYGRKPRFTGPDPESSSPEVFLRWRGEGRIPGTAIAANVARQANATFPITHYFDLDRCCVSCNRPFLFFAEEQKHWYEELGFKLDSDCVRCSDCRKRKQGLARHCEIYETLFHVAEKTIEECLQMAESCLRLIEADVFTTKQTQRVRMLLNSIPADAAVRQQARYARVVEHVISAERRDSQAQ